jgi:hypothetical protein
MQSVPQARERGAGRAVPGQGDDRSHALGAKTPRVCGVLPARRRVGVGPCAPVSVVPCPCRLLRRRDPFSSLPLPPAGVSPCGAALCPAPGRCSGTSVSSASSSLARFLLLLLLVLLLPLINWGPVWG